MGKLGQLLVARGWITVQQLTRALQNQNTVGGRRDVAMQDPRNLVCQDEIAFACGRRVKVHVLHELRIFEALQRYYREECPSRYGLLLDRLNRARYLWAGKESSRPGTPMAPQAQRGPGAPASNAPRQLPGTQ